MSSHLTLGLGNAILFSFLIATVVVVLVVGKEDLAGCAGGFCYALYCFCCPCCTFANNLINYTIQQVQGFYLDSPVGWLVGLCVCLFVVCQ